MATSGKNLSKVEWDKTPSAFPYKFGIVVSEWNDDITLNLAKGAETTLVKLGASKHNIIIHSVPGSFELPIATKWLAESGKVDAIIAVGSIIQGETRHFDFVCEAVAQGIKDVNLQTGIPVVFCVLTDNTHQQGLDRSGGKHGNKGVEAAVAAVKMAQLRADIGQ
jgi:6,7-dimethyl-8-ribityllumazine synthase